MLFSHKAFSVQEAFKVLDADNDGTVSAAEFRECFVKNNLHLDCEFFGLPNEDDQSMFTHNELAEIITPFGHHHNHRVAFYDGSFEQRETQKLAWLESLYELIFA
jgi:Ca2+-binding EF-hand superfamily protein